MTISGDLFASVSAETVVELFEELFQLDGVKAERIISNGHSSPPGDWYDQSWNEWVMVVAGEALIRLESEPEPRHLKAGQWLLLPAHCRHRVEWTVPDQETIWLALHWSEQKQPAEGAIK